MICVFMLNTVMLSVTNKPLMLSVVYAECHYAERHCGDCRGANLNSIELFQGKTGLNEKLVQMKIPRSFTIKLITVAINSE